jgi:group I intron endonuclease
MIRCDEDKALGGHLVDALGPEIRCSVAAANITQGTPVIYKITSPSGKAYVGQSINFHGRMNKHKNLLTNCPGIRNAVAKYGWRNMKVEVLAVCKESELDALEVEAIKVHNTLKPHGYNMLKGGDANPIKDPAIYARVLAMHKSGEIKARQKKGFTAAVRARISAERHARWSRKTEKEREGHRAQLASVCKQGNTASQSEEAKRRARETRMRKREKLFATLTPREVHKLKVKYAAMERFRQRRQESMQEGFGS